MDYNVTYNQMTESQANILASIGVGTWIATLAVAVFMTIVLWKIYTKAGKPGWAAIVPIYNIIVMLEIVKLDWWHILIMLFVPFAAIVYSILIPIKLAKAFGKSAGFGVFAIFFSIIAYPILAFGSATYQE